MNIHYLSHSCFILQCDKTNKIFKVDLHRNYPRTIIWKTNTDDVASKQYVAPSSCNKETAIRLAITYIQKNLME